MPKFLSGIIFLLLLGCENLPFSSEPIKVTEAHYFVKNNLEGESGYQFRIVGKVIQSEISISEIAIKGLSTEHFQLDTISNQYIISGYIPIISEKIRGFRRNFSTFGEEGIIYEFQKNKYIYPLKFQYKN